MRKMLEYVGAKPMRYQTRRLTAGDTITCPDVMAKIWIGTKKFREARTVAKLAPPPAELVAKAVNISDLRDQYVKKFAKRPFHGWDAETLAGKLAE